MTPIKRVSEQPEPTYYFCPGCRFESWPDDEEAMPTPKPAPLPELLPCPFCGFAEHEVFNIGTRSWFCACKTCQARTGMAISEAAAITAWNTRAPSRAPSPVNAALLSALRELIDKVETRPSNPIYHFKHALEAARDAIRDAIRDQMTL